MKDDSGADNKQGLADRGRLMKNTIIIALIVLLGAASASAFDGKRKGFVLGGGLGLALEAGWSIDGTYNGLTDASETKTGFAGQVVIGYDWNEHNMIVYEGNYSGYESDLLSSDPYYINRDIFQGITGVSWYHYFGRVGRSAFATVGAGMYVFAIGNDGGNERRGGIQIGGGSEFARHFQIGLYIAVGRTERYVDFSHSQINLLVSEVGF